MFEEEGKNHKDVIQLPVLVREGITTAGGRGCSSIWLLQQGR